MLNFKKSEEIKKQSVTYLQEFESLKNNKAKRNIRTQDAIDRQTNKISNKVYTSNLTSKQKRKYYAQINK